MSDELKQLDSVRVVLEGINLVEAAAGTGKTYNIQNLVVRLLLEKGLNISQIAVLSFTNEAAAELASRIRRVLTWYWRYWKTVRQKELNRRRLWSVMTGNCVRMSAIKNAFL